MKRLFFLAFFCFVNSLALKAQDLEWLIEPEDFLPPRDITVFFNDTSCTNDFTSDLWEGSYDGGTRVEMWGWEAMEGVHWACDCNGEVFYSHVPSLNVLENYSLSSDASGSSPELIIARPNSVLETRVCLTLYDHDAQITADRYCFDLTVQCGDCGESNNTICETCEAAKVPYAQGGCKICDPYDSNDGFRSCTPPCGWPNCPHQGPKQPLELCNMGGIPNNMSWFAFIASDEEAEIQVDVFNCAIQGVQSGIYTSCDFTECIGYQDNCTLSLPIAYEATFDVGQTYYLFVDGCSGSACEFAVRIKGLNEVIPDDINALTAWSLCSGKMLTDDFSTGASNASQVGPCRIADKISVCPGDVVQFNVTHQGNYGNFTNNDEPCDNYFEGIDATFEWSSSWGDSWNYNPSEEGADKVIPPVQMPKTEGAYSVCLDLIDYDCFPVLGPVCIEIEVVSGLTQEYFEDKDGDGFGIGDPIDFSCPAPTGYACTAGDCDDNDPSVTIYSIISSLNFTCNITGADTVIIAWEENPLFNYEVDLSLVPPDVCYDYITPSELHFSCFLNPCQYTTLSVEAYNPDKPACGRFTESISCRTNPIPTITFNHTKDFYECLAYDLLVLDVDVENFPNPSSGSWTVNTGFNYFVFDGAIGTFDPNRAEKGVYTLSYTYENALGCCETFQTTLSVLECMSVDNDGDGFFAEDDCDDDNAAVYPGAIEIPANGIDEDCDGNDLSYIHELSSSRIKIYPNPASDFIYLEIEGQLRFRACIYDLSGKLVLTAENQFSLDIKLLTQGLYHIRIEDLDSGQQVMTQIVKE